MFPEQKHLSGPYDAVYLNGYHVLHLSRPPAQVLEGPAGRERIIEGRRDWESFIEIRNLCLMNLSKTDPSHWCISCKIALRWMPLDPTDDKSTLVQVMTWCRLETSHYLNQCWPRSPMPYGVTRPQWVNKIGTPNCRISQISGPFSIKCYFVQEKIVLVHT